MCIDIDNYKEIALIAENKEVKSGSENQMIIKLMAKID